MEPGLLLDTLNELKGILLEEKEVLINNESKKLQNIVSKKEAIIEQLEMVETDTADKEDIQILVDEIQELQKTNAMLTQQAMNYVDVFLSAFQKEAQKNSTYSKEGSFKQTENSSILDQSL